VTTVVVSSNVTSGGGTSSSETAAVTVLRWPTIIDRSGENRTLVSAVRASASHSSGLVGTGPSPAVVLVVVGMPPSLVVVVSAGSPVVGTSIVVVVVTGTDGTSNVPLPTVSWSLHVP
jgi:hypothetical protein